MSEYVKFWKKTIFWSKLRDTFGLIGGPTPAGRQTVTLNYEYYSTVNYKGVWKG